MRSSRCERSEPEPRRGEQEQNEAPFAEGEARIGVVGFFDHKNPSDSEEA